MKDMILNRKFEEIVYGGRKNHLLEL